MNIIDIFLSLILASVLFSLSSSRMTTLVKMIAVQGIIASLIPFFLHTSLTATTVIFGILMLGIRGVLIPTSIYFAVKTISIKREVEPIIGYHLSILACLLIMIFSTFISSKFNIQHIAHRFMLPIAMTTFLSGMVLLMTRRKAITMVMGYIIMENGIYLMGMTFSGEPQFLIEFGILLDILVGVMLMGIILNNINKTFDDIDTSLLMTLKE